MRMNREELLKQYPYWNEDSANYIMEKTFNM